jgi:hypothetical protein
MIALGKSAVSPILPAFVRYFTKRQFRVAYGEVTERIAGHPKPGMTSQHFMICGV